MTVRDINHFHLFFGLGGGAAGFSDARPAIPGLDGRYVCIGGVDVDAAGAEDFYKFTGVRGTVRDMFDRSQYQAFHGSEPPVDWKEMLPQDLHTAAYGQRPNVVFLSAPCKGFSGLLSQSLSITDKYQALNRLTLRGVWMMLEAWADDPVEIILFENVPLIATRGRHLLDQITSMLRHYGYIVRETTHDCGEIAGLAQSRKRFLLVARHADKVPSCLYEPPKRPLRGVGDVLSRMHLPGDIAAGPMHRIPNLSWKTWVRLAFVEPGKDWRSLNRLDVENGYLRDYLIVPEHQNIDCSASGAFPITDVRAPAGALQYQQYGVQARNDSSGAIINVKSPGQGTYSVADPRHSGPAKHSNEFRIVPFDSAARAVTSAHGTGQCVADPRRNGPTYGKYAVTLFGEAAGTVISGSTTGQGAYAVADPRPGMRREKGDNYFTGGHYGVLPFASPSGAVSASACHDNGNWSVADPRVMPQLNDKLVCVIRSTDGTWHRPFTTLELAAIQSLYDPDDYQEGKPFLLHGSSDSGWRERIGNAVPRKTAEAIATEIGRTLLLSWTGETFQLSATPIWVRPIATALTVRGNE